MENNPTEEIIKDNFKFIFEDSEVDQRFLHSFEVLSVLKGNLDPIN